MSSDASANSALQPSDVLPDSDAAAQAFVDQGLLALFSRYSGEPATTLDMVPFSALTVIPARIHQSAEVVHFGGCSKLTSVAGLPDRVRDAFFMACTGLTNVEGLPASTRNAFFHGCTSLTTASGLPKDLSCVYFNGCTSLKSVAGLPVGIHLADFSGCTSLLSSAGLSPGIHTVVFNFCTSLVSAGGLPESVRRAYFDGCRRVRRLSTRVSAKSSAVFYVNEDFVDPADEVRACTRSGVGDWLLQRVGPDVALLIGCFATAGINSSPQFHDRVETQAQLIARYQHWRASDLSSGRSFAQKRHWVRVC